jgi:hypothetical protein
MIKMLTADADAEIPLAWQPREILAFEASAEGRAHARRAARRLRELMSEIAGTPPPVRPRTVSEPGEVAVMMSSTAVAAACAKLAARLGVSAPMVVLAAYATALTEWLEVGHCVIRLVCSNRDQAPARMSVAQLAQTVPILVKVGNSFADTVGNVGRQSLRAYAGGHHDPNDFQRIWQEVLIPAGHERLRYAANVKGIRPGDNLSTDLSGAYREAADLSDERICELSADSEIQEFRFPRVGSDPPLDLGFAVWELFPCAWLAVSANAEILNPADTTSILRRVEEVLLTGLGNSPLQ